jgi:hypothetical protein
LWLSWFRFPVNAVVASRLVAAFPNFESYQAIRGGRIGILEVVKFPAGKEFSREFRKFPAISAPSGVNPRSNFSASQANSLLGRSREFFSPEQRILPSQQGLAGADRFHVIDLRGERRPRSFRRTQAALRHIGFIIYR